MTSQRVPTLVIMACMALAFIMNPASGQTIEKRNVTLTKSDVMLLGKPIRIHCDANTIGLDGSFKYVAMLTMLCKEKQIASWNLAAPSFMSPQQTEMPTTRDWNVQFSPNIAGQNNRNISMTLDIKDTQCSDAGIYKCIITAYDLTTYKNVILVGYQNITSRASITDLRIVASPNNTDNHYLVEENVTLTCMVEGPAGLNLEWQISEPDTDDYHQYRNFSDIVTKEAEPITGDECGKLKYESVLNISQLLVDVHNLKYRCLAAYKDDKVTTEVRLNVTVSPDCPQHRSLRCNASGECIRADYVCNGFRDCTDGEDEQNCAQPDVCTLYLPLRCNNTGECIRSEYRCNGYSDCKDSEDEQNCPLANGCLPGNPVRCNSTRDLTFTCINNNQLCDGERDCPLGEDEENCYDLEKKCEDNEVRCNSTRVCKNAMIVCNGKNECPDGEDERDCGLYNKCPATMYHCKKSGQCLPSGWVCNGHRECPDGEDEDCKLYNKCPADSYRCEKSGQCVYGGWVCNGHRECPDGEDEQDCKLYNKCPATFYHCKKSGRCVLDRWVCDGLRECPDGEDEQDCKLNNKCPATMYHCKKSGQCLSSWQVCDGPRECPDGEDEQDCKLYNKCIDGFHWCQPTGKCVLPNYVCDGTKHCPDGSDEDHCGPHLFDRFCKNGAVACNDTGSTVCIYPTRLCDGVNDCKDRGDERDCITKVQQRDVAPYTLQSLSAVIQPRCLHEEIRCNKTSSPPCILATSKCDGLKDCQDGEDELNCPGTLGG